VLVIFVFLFVVRPLLKSVKTMDTAPRPEGQKELPAVAGEAGSATLPEPQGVSTRERTIKLAQGNADKTEQVLKGWLNEEH
jgi:hypothetical protein